MFRHRVTSLAILVVLSLLVQNVDAHLPNGYQSLTPNTDVRRETTGDTCVVRMVMTSSVTFNTGTHLSGENHGHGAYALLQVYYHEPGGSPNVGQEEQSHLGQYGLAEIYSSIRGLVHPLTPSVAHVAPQTKHHTI